MGSDALHSNQATSLPSSLLPNSGSAQSKSSLSKFFPLDARPNHIISNFFLVMFIPQEIVKVCGRCRFGDGGQQDEEQLVEF